MRFKFSKNPVLALCLTAGCVLCASAADKEAMTQEQKESYSIGISTGTYISAQLKKQESLGVKFDSKSILDGFADAFKKEQKLTDEEIISLLNQRDEKLNKLTQDALKKALEKNLKEGEEFMAKNAKNKKVKTTKSGLQYEVMAVGDGDKPRPESVVALNYKAYLINGKVFDDTYSRNEPAILSMVNLIDGLQEGLMMMNGNSKYKFVIPSHLAYGDEGADEIPGGSTLIFEVELVKALKPGELAGVAKKLSETQPRNFHGAHSHGSSVGR